MILVGSGISNDLSSGLALLCRVGSVVCALPVKHVSETMRPLPVEALAGMPAFIAGLAIVRGIPIPVVDLARLLGGSGPLRATRFVTIRIGDRHAAIAVDSVLGVRPVRADALHELAPLLGGAGADAVDAVGTLDTQLVFVLRSARIVPPVVWDAMATTFSNARNGEGALS